MWHVGSFPEGNYRKKCTQLTLVVLALRPTPLFVDHNMNVADIEKDVGVPVTASVENASVESGWQTADAIVLRATIMRIFL